MKLENQQAKDNLGRRLRRIEGQVRGVQSMVTEERDCREILQQLTAVRSAVNSVTQLLMQEYATDCVLNLDNKGQEERETMIQDLVSMLGKAN
jgi:CsoR family transcriptional regulator, copper-sensing transcriptional repressor